MKDFPSVELTFCGVVIVLIVGLVALLEWDESRMQDRGYTKECDGYVLVPTGKSLMWMPDCEWVKK